jgi:hypothetical protein
MEVPFPEFPKARVFVGGCVERGDGSSFRAHAHAHIRDNEWRGWICIRSKKPETLRLADGEPTNLLKHEYAHILTLMGHTRKFYQTLYAIGGYMEEPMRYGHYRKDFMDQRARWSAIKDLVGNSDFMPAVKYLNEHS